MLDQAIKIGANACREVDVLKKELDRLKKKMKEEEKAKAEAQTQQKEKEDLLLKSIIALLGNVTALSFSSCF
jgi:sRNA-binding carbon storage regulator CsrA